MLIPLRLAPVLAAISPPLCWHCGATAPSHQPLCRPCRSALRFLPPDPVPLAGIPTWSAVAYEGPARALVRGLKYRGAAGLSRALAAQIAALAPEELVPRAPEGGASCSPGPVHSRSGAREGGASSSPGPVHSRSGAREGGGFTSPGPLHSRSGAREGGGFTSLGPGHSRSAALVPVPAARARARRRGFDQAALIARALGDRVGIPCLACLERPGRSPPQVGRGRSARLSAPAGSVRLHADTRVPGSAILVDDVITTGATLAACVAALRGAGCERVVAVSYARTPGR